jgi:murein DD-endopeptidase MepM/ murein hydrolase activator NlpD
MISRPVLRNGEADRAQPPNANISSASAAFSFVFDSLRALDQRLAGVVDMRWLVALLLMAAGAILMLDGVWRSLDSGLLAARAPEVYRRAASGGDLPRADRLMPVKRPGERDVIRTHIEEVADAGHGTKSFTHVMVRLLPAALHRHAPGVSPDQRISETAPGTVLTASDRTRAAITALSGASAALPTEIQFGTSQQPPLTHETAFAADESPPPTPLGVPVNLSVIVKSTGTFGGKRRMILARAGDTVDGILVALGVSAEDAGTIATLLSPHSWFGRSGLAGGEVITVLEDGARDHQRPWQVSIERHGETERVAALSDAGLYVAATPRPRAAADRPDDGEDATPPLGVSRNSARSGVKLRDGFHVLAQEKHVAPSLVDDIVRLCANDDVDLEAAISAPDTAELLYDRNAQGERELAFAALTLDGRARRYYRFTAPDDGSTDYYDGDGRSVTLSLIHKPVAEGRLGDGFGWRIHPILGDRRFHEGVDYAAPFGSPVTAAGAGVVEKIDEESGYGRYVRIRHDFGYETTYAHISSVPRGLRIGMRVHPGQTIAYIGSTGLSTGPHLYYELRVNGRYANPLLAHLRAGRILEGDVLAAFQKARGRIDLLLQASARTAVASR